MGKRNDDLPHRSPRTGSVWLERRGERLIWKARQTEQGQPTIRISLTVPSGLTGARHDAAVKRTRQECERLLMRRILDRTPAQPDAELPPPPTEIGPDGREFVRLVSPAFRRWIYKRDRGLCGICGKSVVADGFHVDHVRPVIEGGNNHVDNLRISHPRCNLRRSSERQMPILVG